MFKRLLAQNQKKKTALEKLLVKQTSQLAKRPANHKLQNKKSKEEQAEDQQIAWLEAQLGLNTGQQAKVKLRKEFEEDGLEDLFDGLDELDELVDDLTAQPGPSRTLEDIGDSTEEPFSGDVQDDNESFNDSLESNSTWLGCDLGSEVEDLQSRQDVIAITSEAPAKPDETVSNSQNLTDDRNQQEPVTNTADHPHRYVPPHLRSKQEQSPKDSENSEQPVMDLRLKRKLMGILNRVSPTSLPTCLDSLRDLYISHPRAVITHGLGGLILELISSNDTLNVALLVTYAALVSAITRGGAQVSGVEIGWAAAFMAELAVKICQIYPAQEFNETPPMNTDDCGKSGINLLAFLSHLYFFQVVGCTFVYDIVRLLIEKGLSEHRVEGLIVLLKTSGPRLRHDDPGALKNIILLVQAQRKTLENPSPRTKFMLDALSDLKNNKTRKDPQSISGTAEELQENLRKFLVALSKKSGSNPEPIQCSLKDLQDARKKGKWWLVGAGWNGNPLVDSKLQFPSKSEESTTQDSERITMMDLARRQGMNTEVRRCIFAAIMTGEDYVDACEKVSQLGLNSVQQREIIRVLLHCLGKEKNYNPYYTIIGQKLASESKSIQITMQFLLWDFFRELGEKEVGGQDMLKSLNLRDPDESLDDSIDGSPGSAQKLNHFAWAYGWWIGKGCLPITVLKPLPFGCLKRRSLEFLTKLIALSFISIQSTSPTLLSPSFPTTTKSLSKNHSKSLKINTSSIEDIFKKILIHSNLAKSFLNFLDVSDEQPTSFNSNLEKNFNPQASSDPEHNVNWIEFCGSFVSRNQNVHFLDLIRQSQCFVTDFLSHQL